MAQYDSETLSHFQTLFSYSNATIKYLYPPHNRIPFFITWFCLNEWVSKPQLGPAVCLHADHHKSPTPYSPWTSPCNPLEESGALLLLLPEGVLGDGKAASTFFSVWKCL